MELIELLKAVSKTCSRRESRVARDEHPSPASQPVLGTKLTAAAKPQHRSQQHAAPEMKQEDLQSTVPPPPTKTSKAMHEEVRRHHEGASRQAACLQTSACTQFCAHVSVRYTMSV